MLGEEQRQGCPPSLLSGQSHRAADYATLLCEQALQAGSAESAFLCYPHTGGQADGGHGESNGSCGQGEVCVCRVSNETTDFQYLLS